VFVKISALAETSLPVYTVVTILFVPSTSGSPLLESRGSDLMNADLSLPPECIALYPIADPSPDTRTSCQCLTTSSRVVLNPTLLRSSHPPRFSPGASNPTALRGGTEDHGPTHIVSVTQLARTRMTYKATAFSPTDEIRVEFIPGGSVSSLAHENTHDKPDSPA